MQFKQMFVTAVCALFLLKLEWPKSTNFHNFVKSEPGEGCIIWPGEIIFD